MSVSIKQGFYCALAALLVALAPVRAHADSAGLGLNPGRAEVEVMPGEEKTVSFRIDSPPSEQPVRGHLMLSLTDWKINQDTSLTYVDPGSLPDSASSWVVFSPSSLSIDSGQSQLVRVTVRVPEGTTKGVYRAVFRCGHEPGRGIGGHPAQLPNFECTAEGVLNNVFCHKTITQNTVSQRIGITFVALIKGLQGPFLVAITKNFQ